MTLTANYPIGIDCVWIAEDLQGMLAAFITAGMGPIPKFVIEDGDDLIHELENNLMRFPMVSAVHLHIDVPRPDDFISLAERGFFVYDWRDAHCCSSLESICYVRVASPENAVNNSGLYLDATRTLRVVHMRDIDFRASEYVGVSALENAVFPDDHTSQGL